MKSFLKTVYAAIAGLALLLALCGCGVDVEASAKPVVEQIFKQAGADVKCEGIKNIKDLGNNKYEGSAIVKNADGETAIVSVKMEVVGDMISVEVVE